MASSQLGHGGEDEVAVGLGLGLGIAVQVGVLVYLSIREHPMERRPVRHC